MQLLLLMQDALCVCCCLLLSQLVCCWQLWHNVIDEIHILVFVSSLRLDDALLLLSCVHRRACVCVMCSAVEVAQRRINHFCAYWSPTGSPPIFRMRRQGVCVCVWHLHINLLLRLFSVASTYTRTHIQLCQWLAYEGSFLRSLSCGNVANALLKHTDLMASQIKWQHRKSRTKSQRKSVINSEIALNAQKISRQFKKYKLHLQLTVGALERCLYTISTYFKNIFFMSQLLLPQRALMHHLQLCWR